MGYLALYRRFRPTTFDKLIGQEHITRTLINQIKNDRVGHAYLFCGARGTGKTSAAKIFAKAVNCLNNQNGSPCNKCECCIAMNSPSNLDIIEIDAASNNKVEEIRDLREKAQYPPQNAKYKVYIVDEVHMLTDSAFNALLKTLEEPPRHVIFILATTEAHKLPATILSRCMRFDFKLISMEKITSLLADVFKEIGKEYEEDALKLIAKAGAGSIRDALSVADICVSYSTKKLTASDVLEVLGASDTAKLDELVKYIMTEDIGNVLVKIDEIAKDGKSMGVLLKDILELLRQLLIAKTCDNVKEILTLPNERFLEIEALSEVCDRDKLVRSMEIFTFAESELRYSSLPRVILETASLKSAKAKNDYNIDALLERIKALEDRKVAPTMVMSEVEDRKVAPNMMSEVEVKNVAPTMVMSEVEDRNVDRENTKVEEKTMDFIPPPENYFEEIKPELNLEYSQSFSNKAKFESVQDFSNKAKFENVQEFSKVTTRGSEDEFPKMPTNEVNSTKIETNKIWGTLIKELRRKQYIMLWTVLRELRGEVEAENLKIFTETDTDNTILTKAENLKILNEIVKGFSSLNVEIVASKKVNSQDDFDSDIEKMKNLFGEDIIKIK